MKIDGILEKEWFNSEPVEIQNDDNRYKIYSCWNKDNLYMAAEVIDKFVYTRFLEMKEDQLNWDSIKYTKSNSFFNRVWLDDCLGFFFDINTNRTSLLEPNDMTLEISPTGVFLSLNLDVYKQMFYNLKGVRCSTNFLKNQHNDTMGYVIELAIPWKSLDIDPDKTNKIGFEIYMVDKEDADSPRVISSWSGDPHNHLNPSEWGTLILEQESTFPMKMIVYLIVTFIILIIFGMYLVYRKRLVKPVSKHSKIKPTRKEYIAKEAKLFIQKNYKDSSLNRDKIAAFLNISRK